LCAIIFSHANLSTTICGSILHEINNYEYAGVVGETTITMMQNQQPYTSPIREAHNIVALRNMEREHKMLFEIVERERCYTHTQLLKRLVVVGPRILRKISH
jgi:hypothetical protein